MFSGECTKKLTNIALIHYVKCDVNNVPSLFLFRSVLLSFSGRKFYLLRSSRCGFHLKFNLLRSSLDRWFQVPCLDLSSTLKYQKTLQKGARSEALLEWTRNRTILQSDGHIDGYDANTNQLEQVGHPTGGMDWWGIWGCCSPQLLEREYDAIAAKMESFKYEKLTSLYWLSYIESFLLLKDPTHYNSMDGSRSFEVLWKQKPPGTAHWKAFRPRTTIIHSCRSARKGTGSDGKMPW